MKKSQAKKKPKEITLTVVGLQYRLIDPKLKDMQEVTPLKTELRRDPENIHDENAIAVYVMEKPYKGTHVGYLKRQVAHDLAPEMDRGKFSPREVWLTEITFSNQDRAHTGTLLVKL